MKVRDASNLSPAAFFNEVKCGTRAIVIIRTRMQNETSPVSKQAGNPAKIAGSPGRILSLVDPAWQRDSLVYQTVSKIVSLRVMRMSLQ